MTQGLYSPPTVTHQECHTVKIFCSAGMLRVKGPPHLDFHTPLLRCRSHLCFMLLSESLQVFPCGTTER